MMLHCHFLLVVVSTSAITKPNNFVISMFWLRPPNTRTEMYAGHIACCPLLSHVDYVPLRLEKRQDR